ncbi:hypothetical protein [Mesorhizobium sp. B2-8-5]|uniref:hypothetical protein n=1 Tax=Mesorhizobium sp. B2-8-5 TaxID=2589903 RepID=UPI0015E430ED|nr:hypothetical protein [Mesorhizobium sp. B2-8-5]UCI28214.1 hypothetical protein FJ430_11690 [Mesorhizobium sp. B2-8-5]
MCVDPLPEAECPQLKAEPFHAGTWRAAPGRPGTVWRFARLPPSFEHLDHDHAAVTAWAWRAEVVRFVRGVIVGRYGYVEEFTSKREAGLASGTGKRFGNTYTLSDYIKRLTERIDQLEQRQLKQAVP